MEIMAESVLEVSILICGAILTSFTGVKFFINREGIGKKAERTRTAPDFIYLVVVPIA